MAKETHRDVPPSSSAAAPDAAAVNPAAANPAAANPAAANPAVLSERFAELLPPGAAAAEIRLPVDASLEGMLPPGERASIARAIAQRRQEFAAGRLCARRLLAARGVADFELLPGPDRAPLWPPGVVGSITHTAGYCAAAIAERDRIAILGIDAEIAGAVGEDLWPRLFTAEEIGRLGSLAPPARGEAAALLFAGKEAFYKSQYPLTGQRLEFHDLCIGWEGPADADGCLPPRGTLRIEPRRRLALFDAVRGALMVRYRLCERYASVAVAVDVAGDDPI